MRQRYRNLADYFKRSEQTQDALAAKLGISKSHMSLIKTGKRQPALSLAMRIEAETGVPAESMVAEGRL